jgi:hypothetical protein
MMPQGNLISKLNYKGEDELDQLKHGKLITKLSFNTKSNIFSNLIFASKGGAYPSWATPKLVRKYLMWAELKSLI